jgi:predicted ATPase
MLFYLVTNEHAIRQAASPGVYLIHDNWNDWFKFRTMYTLYIVSTPGQFVNVGSVKIGQKGMTDRTESPALPEVFETLDDSFFSIGQDEDYYQTLNQLPDIRESVYSGLRDCAYYPDVFFEVMDEYVMAESLLRSLSVRSVRGRLNRLAHGNAELTRYSFVYAFPSAGEAGDTELSFEVNPVSTPPTNVHVLIGRNGVGKTRCLSGMIGAILGRKAPDGHIPGIFRQESAEDTVAFANLIAVSFSAFDPADPLPKDTVGNQVMYAYVGLKRQTPKKEQSDSEQGSSKSAPTDNLPKDKATLAEEFAASMIKCQEGLRKDRWRRALDTLETDPLFKEAEVASFAATDIEGDWRTTVIDRFVHLSSGHAIVLLTITRLVELVEERSLVLIDEPEGHLHPPLLSAFVRALSDLLVQRNGVAIVATHSPVVLQEVPTSCVWLLSRSKTISRVDRPEIETFGENVGVLTREVFALEVTHSGFHALIDRAVKTNEGSYEAVLQHFGNQLGAEGRAIARGLCVSWTPEVEDDLSTDEGE